MKWFSNLSTRTKLYFGFGSIMLLMGVITVMALTSLRSIRGAAAFTQDLGEIRADLERQRSRLLEMVIAKDPAAVEATWREIQDGMGEVDAMYSRLAEYARGRPTILTRLEEMQKARMAYRTGREAQHRLVVDGKASEAADIDATAQRERFNTIRTAALQLSAQAQEDEDRVVTRATLVFTGAGAGAMVLALVMVVILNRAITGRLTAFMRLTERIGQGDLTQRASVATADAASSRNEFDRLGYCLNQMVAGLTDLAGQTTSVAGNLNSAAAEILASTQQQSASTREQAATVQEITGTMQELNQSGGQISDRAKQVAVDAQAASSTSKSGLQAITETNRIMETIREQVEDVAQNVVALSEKTQAVGEIVVTVNEIAEQSNLLALNASIEAASAGEQGGRFSVVANEMKNLADQAKQCTVQVRTILGDIQKGISTCVMLTEEAFKRVEAGKEQAGVTGQTIRQVAEVTEQSIHAFQQIIGASNQQQIGFNQVTQGMEDIRQAASQTAAGTSQLEKAVASVTALSQQLKTAVGRYQVR